MEFRNVGRTQLRARSMHDLPTGSINVEEQEQNGPNARPKHAL